MSWDPDWWERYREFLDGPLWAEIRQQALDYHGAQCARCGRWQNQLDPGEWLEVDHLTYERAMGNELMADLQVLCNTCHRDKTKAARRWRTVKRVLGV